jgi:hypothetical protein
MGLIFGLLVIALIARTILRIAPRGRDRKGAGGAIMLAALAVLIIGYVGLFFGRLIQAAISRRRESLADASAVQFTRDPTGLRNALVKIGAAGAGSRIGNPEVDEVAHMLFAPGMKRLFSTHPPLLERLKAIDPHFDPEEIERVRAQMMKDVDEGAGSAGAPARATLDGLIDLPGAVSGVAQLVGNPATVHMQIARDIRESLPDSITEAGRHAESAKALLLALALDSDAESRARQQRFIAQQLGQRVASQVEQLESAVNDLAPEQRMPALLRTFPALRQLTRDERLQLMSCLNGMLPINVPDKIGISYVHVGHQREGRLGLQSYVLRKLAQVQLRDAFDPGAQQRLLPLSRVQQDAQILFSVLAQHGHETSADARHAYEVGMHHLYPRERPEFVQPPQWSAALDIALARLDRVAPVAKEQLVEGMLKTVTHDRKLTIGEAELFRAVCATLHCPLPPLVA